MPVNAAATRRYVLNNSVFNRLMKAAGWTTSKECARALDMHQSTIARLRAHETSPTYAVARHMAERLEVPHHLLFIPHEEAE